jgi:hypothetical protein
MKLYAFITKIIYIVHIPKKKHNLVRIYTSIQNHNILEIHEQ